MVSSKKSSTGSDRRPRSTHRAARQRAIRAASARQNSSCAAGAGNRRRSFFPRSRRSQRRLRQIADELAAITLGYTREPANTGPSAESSSGAGGHESANQRVYAPTVERSPYRSLRRRRVASHSFARRSLQSTVATTVLSRRARLPRHRLQTMGWGSTVRETVARHTTLAGAALSYTTREHDGERRGWGCSSYVLIGADHPRPVTGCRPRSKPRQSWFWVHV